MKSKGSFFRTFFLGLNLFSFVLLGSATTISWNNASGGLWNDAVNWSPAQVPGAGDIAQIVLDGTYTVTLNGNVSLDGLILGAASGTQTLQNSSFTLTLNAASSVEANGVFEMEGGVLNGSVAMSVSGIINWTGGQFSGAGTMDILSGGLLALSGTSNKNFNNGFTINNSGRILWSGSGALHATSGPIINNNGFFDIQNDGFFDYRNFGKNAVFNNNGTLLKSGGTGNSNMEFTFNNSGTIEVQSGNVNLLNGATLNTGSVFSGSQYTLLGGGTVNLNGTIAGNKLNFVSGTMIGTGTLQGSVGEPAVMTWTGGSIVSSAVLNIGENAELQIIGPSTKTFTGSAVINNGGLIQFDGDGPIHATSGPVFNNLGTFEILGDGVFDFRDFGNNAVFNNNGLLLKSGGTGNSIMEFTFINSGVVDIQSGNFNLPNGATLNNGSVFTGTQFTLISGGTLNLNGTFGGNKLNFVNGSMIGSGTLQGTVEDPALMLWTGGSIVSSAVLTIGNNAELQITGSATKTFTGSAVINNNGLIQWDDSGSIQSSSGPVLNNSTTGIWNIAGDQFFDYRDFGASPVVNNAGLIQKTAGTGNSILEVVMNNQSTGLIKVNSGILDLARGGNSAGNFQPGFNFQLRFTGLTHVIQEGAVFSGSGLSVIAGGTVNVEGAATATGDVGLSSGVLGGVGTLTVQSLFNWTGGTMQSAGTLNIASGGTLDIFGVATKTFTGGRIIENNGTIVWRDSGNIHATSGPVFNNLGTFEIQNDQTFDFLDFGANATFNNSGVIRKTIAAGATIMEFVFNNSGQVDLLSGTIRFPVGATFNTGSDFTGTEFTELTGGTFTLGGILSGAKLNFSGGTMVGNGTLQGTAGDPAVILWTGGAMSSAGSLTIGDHGELKITGAGIKTFSNFVINNGGLIRWDGAGPIHASSAPVINNLAGGSLEIDGDQFFDYRDFGSLPIINNDGIIRKNQGSLNSVLEAVVNNNSDGLIEALSGQLDLARGGTSSGEFRAGSGAELRFTGATHTILAGGLFSGDGLNRISGGTINVNGAASSTGNFQLSSGILGGTGVFTISNLFNWTGGTIQSSGTLTIAAGGVMDIFGTGNKIFSNNRIIENQGTVFWRETGDIHATSGPVFNNHGTFEIQNDQLFDFRNFGANATFNNFGVIRKTTAAVTDEDVPVAIDVLANDEDPDARGVGFTGAGFVPLFFDFEGVVGSEWSSSLVDASTEGNFTRFSGRYGNEEQRLTVVGLTEGEFYSVVFDLYIIDSWDGERTDVGPDRIVVSVNGVDVFNETFSHSGTAQSFDRAPDVGPVQLGFSGSFLDSIYRGVGVSFRATGSEAVIGFRGEGLQELDDESWGMDNVLVQEDPEAGVLRIIRVSQAANGVVEIDEDLAGVSYTPNPDFNGSDSFTYTISDQFGGAEDTAIVTVEVIPVPDAPVAVDDAVVTDENHPIVISVLNNDSDGDPGDVLRIVSVEDSTIVGGVAINGDGTITYDPTGTFDPLFTGQMEIETFTYTIEDSGSLQSTATVEVTVTGVNDPPVAVDDSMVTDEDVPVAIDVLANDEDPDAQGVGFTGAGFVPLFFDFEGAVGSEWSSSLVEASAEGNFTRFSGRYGNEEQRLTVGGLTEGVFYRVEFDLYIIDSWDGSGSFGPDRILVSVDGVDTFNETFSNLGKVQSFNRAPDVGPVHLGFSGSYPDSIYRGVGVSFAAAGTEAVIGFRGGGLQSLGDESWGIDNVLVQEDIEAGILRIVRVSQAANGVVEIDGSLAGLTYTPDPDFNGSDSFTYTLSDGDAEDTATVNVEVLPVNDPPTAVADGFEVIEDSGVSVLEVLANDSSDPDTGELLEILSVGTPGQGGTVSISSIAERPATILEYEPPTGFLGDDVFSYTIGDGNGGTAEAEVTVHVIPSNQPPDIVRTSEPGIVFELSDAESGVGSLTVEGFSSDQSVVRDEHILLDPVDGFPNRVSLSVDSEPGITGSVAVEIRVSDPEGAHSSAFVDLDVTSGVAQDGYIQGATYFLDLNGNRTADEGEPTGTTGPSGEFGGVSTSGSGGTWILSGGTDIATGLALDQTFSAPSGATVINPLTTLVVALQGSGLSESETEAAVKEALGISSSVDLGAFDPIAEIQAGTADAAVVLRVAAQVQNLVNAVGAYLEGVGSGVSASASGAAVFEALATQILNQGSGLGSLGDAAQVESIINGAASNLSVDVSGQSDTVSAAAQVVGEVNQVLENFLDGSSGSTESLLRVAQVQKHAQSALSADLNSSGSGEISSSELISRNTGSALTDAVLSTAVSDPTGSGNTPGTVEFGVGSLTVDESAGSVTLVIVRNGGSLGDLEVVVATVDGTAVAGEDYRSLNSTLIFPDGQESSETLILEVIDDVLVEGEETLTLRIESVKGGGEIGSQSTVSVNIVSGDLPPEAVGDAFTVVEDSVDNRLDLVDNDVAGAGGGQDLRVVGVGSGSAGGRLGIREGGSIVLYTPRSDFFGSESFEYTVGDGTEGGRATAGVTVKVTGVNDAPLARADDFIVNEDSGVTRLEVLINDSPGPGESGLVSVEAVGSGSAKGTARISSDGRAIDYEPAEGFSGVEKFQYRISDGELSSNPARVNISVLPVNDAPTAGSAEVRVNEDESVRIELVGSDPDEDALSFRILRLPVNGELIGSAPSFEYRPKPDFSGSDRLEFEVSDGRLSSQVAVIRITVDPVNDPPAGGEDVFETPQTEVLAIEIAQLLSNDRDVEDGTVSFLRFGQPEKGRVTQSAEGVLGFDPGADFDSVPEGEREATSFNYFIGDSGGLESSVRVIVTVIGVNRNPVANADEAATDEDTAVVVDVLANDGDPDEGDEPVLESVSREGVLGRVSVEDGKVRYDPVGLLDHLAEGESLVERFGYTVTDGRGGRSKGTVEVIVSGRNDAPIARDDFLEVLETEMAEITVAGGLLGNDTDVDRGDTLRVVSIIAEGAQGDLTQNAQGNLEYRPPLTGLERGQRLREVFSYVIEDEAGAEASAQLLIDVIGVFSPPLAVLKGPDAIAFCEVFELDGGGSLSRVEGSEALSYEWELLFPQSARLRNFLRQQNEGTVSLDPVLLDRPGIEYRIGVRVIDSIGQQATASVSVVRALPEAAQVSMGSAGSEVLRSQSVRLRAQVSVESCAVREPLFYQWRIDPAPLSGGGELLLNQSELLIAAGTLEPGVSYTIGLVSGLTTVPELFGQAERTLEVVISDLVAEIAGGDRESLFSSELSLDGSGSFDPDNVETELEYQWTREGRVLGTEALLVIGAHSLPPGDNRFELRVRDADRMAFDTVEVFVVGGIPPLLKIEQPVPQRINPDEPLRVGAIADELPDADLRFIWQVISSGGPLDLEALERAGEVRFEETPLTSRLFMSGGVLQGGVDYLFRAKAVDAQGLEGTATVEIGVNEAPTVAIVEPADGTRLVSKKGLQVRDIRLRAEAFDADGIAQVDFFRVRQLDGVAVRQLLGFDDEAPYEAVLPNASPDIYEFVAVAVDRQGQKTGSVPVRVEVIGELPPRITQHPRSQEVTVGDDVTIQVIAEGTGSLRYRWRKNGVNLIDADNVSGSRTPELTIQDVRIADAGRYSVVVQDANDAIISLIGTLDVAFVGVELFFGDNLEDAGDLSDASGIGFGTNIGFTREVGEPLHAEKVAERSGWLKWTAPETGIVTISTEGSDFDTVLASYRLVQGQQAQLPGFGTEQDSNDDGGQGQRFLSSQIRFNAISGTQYHIAVAGSGNSEGNIVLSWNLEPTDSLAPQIFGPLILGQGGGTQVVESGTENIVIQVEVASDDPVDFTWFVGGQPVTRPVVTVGNISTVTIDQVAIADIGPYIVRVQNTVTQELRNSKPLILQIGETDRRADAKYSQIFADVVAIDLQAVGAAAQGGAQRAGQKRDRGKAAVSRGFTNTQIFNTFGSTTESGEPNHCDVVGGASQWFPFIPENGGRTVVNTDGSDFDTVLAVYTSTTADFSDLVLVGCDNNSGLDGLDSSLSFQAVAGVTYFIAVDGVDGATGLVQLATSQVEVVGEVLVSLSSAQVVAGGTVVLTADVGGDTDGLGTLRYQWRLNGVNLAVGEQSEASLLLEAITLDEAGDYTVVVSNEAGSVESAAVSLEVLSGPVIVTQPQSFEVVQGQSATFEVVVRGTEPILYQWFRDGIPLIFENASVMKIEATVAGDSGNYSVKLTNNVGDPADSEEASLVVSALAQEPQMELFSPESILPGAVGVHLQWTTTVGVTYRVEVSEDLLNWNEIGTVTATGTVSGYIDETALNLSPGVFYRITVE